ncbi:MAG: hypothetical protein R3A47_04885 [Polyangiales bacterium]
MNQPPCSADLLIDTSNLDCSFVLTKISGTPKCGQRMPVDETHYWTDAELDCFRIWLRENF